MKNYFVRLLPYGGILTTTWYDDRVDVVLYDCPEDGHHYEGTLFLGSLKSTAEELEIPLAQFHSETESALTRSTDSHLFQYVISLADDGKCNFTWKKTVDGACLIYGTMLLSKCDHRSLVDVLERLQEDNQKLKEENVKLKRDNDLLESNYQSLSGVANELEQTLLSKCRLIINSKKDRIRELEERLKDVGNSRPTTCQVASEQESEDSVIPPLKRRNMTSIFSQSTESDSPELASIAVPKRQRVKDMSLIESILEDDSQPDIVKSPNIDDEANDELFKLL